MDQYSLYAIYATLEALENAKLDMDTVDRDRTGVIVSSGIGGLQEMQEQIIRMHEKGIKRIQSFVKYGCRKHCFAYWCSWCM